jgi:hypothetical protein
MSEAELKDLCSELRSILQHELEAGNRVIAVDTGWSKVALAVRLAGPLDMKYIRKAAAGNPDLEIWTSRDIKNPQENGVLCKSSRQTLSGTILRSSPEAGSRSSLESGEHLP